MANANRARGVVLSTDINGSAKTSLVYRGVKEISEMVGINPKRFSYYVNNLKLPVFKSDPESNVWLACHTDLLEWIEMRKRIYFGVQQE